MIELLLSAQMTIARVCIPSHPCDVYVTECKKNCRDQFPRDRVALSMPTEEDDRGSGRRDSH